MNLAPKSSIIQIERIDEQRRVRFVGITVNQARYRTRVVNPVNNLPITKQIWQGVVRNISSKNLALANFLLLAHKHIENMLRDLGRRMHVFARARIIDHPPERANTLTRWHVAKKGNEEAQRRHHAPSQRCARARPLLALNNGLERSPPNLAIRSGSSKI